MLPILKIEELSDEELRSFYRDIEFDYSTLKKWDPMKYLENNSWKSTYSVSINNHDIVRKVIDEEWLKFLLSLPLSEPLGLYEEQEGQCAVFVFESDYPYRQKSVFIVKRINP